MGTFVDGVRQGEELLARRDRPRSPAARPTRLVDVAVQEVPGAEKGDSRAAGEELVLRQLREPHHETVEKARPAAALTSVGRLPFEEQASGAGHRRLEGSRRTARAHLDPRRRTAEEEEDRAELPGALEPDHHLGGEDAELETGRLRLIGPSPQAKLRQIEADETRLPRQRRPPQPNAEAQDRERQRHASAQDHAPALQGGESRGLVPAPAGGAGSRR